MYLGSLKMDISIYVYVYIYIYNIDFNLFPSWAIWVSESPDDLHWRNWRKLPGSVMVDDLALVPLPAIATWSLVESGAFSDAFITGTHRTDKA